MATLFKPMDVQVNGDGITLGGAKLYFHQTGTSTPQDTYSDAGLTTPNPNPVLADADGLWPPIYLGTTDYKAILKTTDDVTVATLDPVLVNPQSAPLSESFDEQFGSTEGSLIERGPSVWQAVTFKTVLDRKFGTGAGQMIYRGSGDWAALTAPTGHSVLASVGTDPRWLREATALASQSGGTVTKIAYSGIASVTRNAQGKYTVVLNPAFPDANYAVHLTAASDPAGTGIGAREDKAARTASSFQFYCAGDNVGLQDFDRINILVKEIPGV